ncbi:MAG TPA: hypothetical protein VGE29_08120 [Prosthecobacter sp.]
MANLTASATWLAQASVPARLPDGFGLNREVRRFIEKYTFDAAPAANDLIPLVRMQPGGNVKLIPHLSRISHQGAGTTLTVSLVDSAGAVLFAAVNALTAGGINFGGEDLEVPLPADGQLFLKLATEADVVANDVLQVSLAFVQE